MPETKRSSILKQRKFSGFKIFQNQVQNEGDSVFFTTCPKFIV